MAFAGHNNHTDILLEVGTNELEIIEFIVGDQHFAVNVAKVKQVVRWRPEMLTSVHDAPASVLGMIYHREKPVTLVDLRKALDIDAQAVNPARMLVLVTQFNDIFTAFLIDRVNRIHRISWNQLEPFKEIMPGLTSYITGSVQIEKRVLMVLDLEHLMSVITPQSGMQATQKNLAAITSDSRRNRIKIMFAEDSTMIRKLTSGQLMAAGYTQIELFENGARAHERLLQIQEQARNEGRPFIDYCDLLLTDIEMPQMDGLTLCKILKKDMGLKELPVVVYSSLINDQMAAKCRAVGSNAHISKPRIDQIVAIVDQLVGLG